MPDSERQARTPRIMWFPQPHDPDGRPCLPTNHPRSQPPGPPHPPRPLQDSEPPHLLASLASVPDPRATRGRRHRLVAILGLAAAAVLAGARSIAAIAQWAADAPQPVRAALGARRGHVAVPAEATPPDPFPPGPRRARRCCRRLAGRPGPGPRSRSEPAGGGRWRSTARRWVAPTHPTATAARCTCWRRWTTPAARWGPNTRVGGAPEEVPAFAPLLAPLDLADVVVTADALQTHPEAAWVPGHQQPGPRPIGGQDPPATLLDRLKRLAWRLVPELDRTGDRGHGRIEIRTLTAVSVHHFGFPHAAQASRSPPRPATCATIPGGSRP